MGMNIDILKGEFTRKPEELPEGKLKAAQSLSGGLTQLRKFLYFFFSVGVAFMFVMYANSFVVEPFQIIFWVLLIFFGLFKLRDYIRGTI